MKLLQLLLFLVFLYLVIGPLLPGRARAKRGWWNSGQMWMTVMIAIAVIGVVYWLWERLS